MATATPIILELRKVMDAAGIKTEDVKTAIIKAADGFKKQTGVNVNDVIFKKDEGNNAGGETILTQSDAKPTTEFDAEKVADKAIKDGAGIVSKPNYTPLLIGGGILAALLMLKR